MPCPPAMATFVPMLSLYEVAPGGVLFVVGVVHVRFPDDEPAHRIDVCDVLGTQLEVQCPQALASPPATTAPARPKRPMAAFE